METTIGNTAATPATSPTALEVTGMSNAYRIRLESYLASMLQAKKMLSAGILSSEDYAKIDTIIAKKYGISSCSLYRGINLLYSRFNGNMSCCKEVLQCQKA